MTSNLQFRIIFHNQGDTKSKSKNEVICIPENPMVHSCNNYEAIEK